MGLFDYFTREGKLKRHIQRIRNRDALPEDREASVQWLADDGSPKALLGLLSRFDMNLTQRIKDSDEKDYVYQLLMSLGDPVERPLRVWLQQCKQLPLPVRMLEDVCGLEETTQTVYRLLERELEKDDFKPQKKKSLLIWLSQRRDDGAIEAATPFLRDFDEDVRYCAAEVIIHQEDDAGRVPLLAALANPDEDSNRVPARICEVFSARRWSVAGADLADRIPPEFTIVSEKVVRATAK